MLFRSFWPGQFDKAREAMVHALSIADPHALLPEGFSQDPEIANRGILAWALASLGLVNGATREIDAALDRGAALNHPFSMAYALGSAMWAYFIIRDEVATEDFAEQLVQISDEHGFPYFRIAGMAARAWARAALGSPEAALTELREALEAWRKNAGDIGMALFLYVQAEIEVLAGRPEEALRTLVHPILRDRLEVEQWYLADAVRLRGAC